MTGKENKHYTEESVQQKVLLQVGWTEAQSAANCQQ
jgi:hypothetical protein